MAAFIPPAQAQNASINGYVSDIQNGETLIGANVGLREINRGATTNSSGYYSIPNLPPGTYSVVASYIGYHIFEQEVVLVAGETLRLNIDMAPETMTLDEIVVLSEEELREQRNIGVAQMTTQFIREVPSVIEPDLFRALQLLPGVKAASDFSSGLYIRGGSPDQTLILLDETTVYNPSHFFGFYSTFNPDAVKDVRLYKGGYPARFGGRLGSVLTVYNKDGNRNEFSGTASVGMLASRAMIEGPHRYGSWMLAIRRSTLDPLLALLRRSQETVPDLFYFVDINSKVNIDLSDRDRISLALYTGQDRVNVPFAEDAVAALDYGNRTVSMNWRHIYSDRVFGTATLTASNYRNEPSFELGGTPFERINAIRDYSAKTDIEFLINEGNTLSAGIWAGILGLRFRDRFDGQETFHSRISTSYGALYIQNLWKPSNRWRIKAGLRANHFQAGEYLRFEPRLSVEYSPYSELRLQAAYGRYYQFLTLISNEAFSGFDMWLTTTRGVPPAWGDQWVFGVKSIPFSGYGLDVEVYFRTMNDLFELDPFLSDASGLAYPQLFRYGEGFAYGSEIFFERRIGALKGFAGYTFGVTRRKFPGFNESVLEANPSARYYPPKHDRTHDLNVVLSYDLTDRWRLSTVFSYATGQAYTTPTGRTRIVEAPWADQIRETFVVDRLNASRLPSYHRLDLGVSRTGTFFGIAEGEWQFQVINAYSRKNIWFYQYDFDENPVERDAVYLLPVLPAISYTVQF